MAYHGRCWHITAYRGIPWQIMSYHGIVADGGVSLQIMGYHGRSWLIIAYQGRSLQIEAYRGRSRHTMADHAISCSTPSPSNLGISCSTLAADFSPSSSMGRTRRNSLSRRASLHRPPPNILLCWCAYLIHNVRTRYLLLEELCVFSIFHFFVVVVLSLSLDQRDVLGALKFEPTARPVLPRASTVLGALVPLCHRQSASEVPSIVDLSPPTPGRHFSCQARTAVGTAKQPTKL